MPRYTLHREVPAPWCWHRAGAPGSVQTVILEGRWGPPGPQAMHGAQGAPCPRESCGSPCRRAGQESWAAAEWGPGKRATFGISAGIKILCPRETIRRFPSH